MPGPYKWGKHSKKVHLTLHPALQTLVDDVIKYYDCTLLRGIRTMEQQQEYFDMGWSKTLNSRHLPGGGYMVENASYPDKSYAVDMAPFINGKVSYEPRHVAHFMGYVKARADWLGIKIRWGGDWDSDFNQAEHSFWDGVHVELLRGVYG